MPRFSANLSMMFTEWAFLDRFAAAADAGFEAVEYLFPYDHAPDAVGAALTRNGLTQVLFNLPPGDVAAGDWGIAAVPGREAELRASVETALTYAKATGAKRLHVLAGKSAKDARSAATYRDSIAFAADALACHGIDLLLEPLNGRDVPGYYLDDFAVAAGIIRELGRPNLHLQFDIYHRQILHGDVLMGLESLMPLIGHVQTASVPLRQEPGTGELDDFRIFATLDRLGYDGFVGCEYRPAAGTLAGLGWMRQVGI